MGVEIDDHGVSLPDSRVSVNSPSLNVNSFLPLDLFFARLHAREILDEVFLGLDKPAAGFVEGPQRFVNVLFQDVIPAAIPEIFDRPEKAQVPGIMHNRYPGLVSQVENAIAYEKGIMRRGDHVIVFV
jgi:hypothetical protein